MLVKAKGEWIMRICRFIQTGIIAAGLAAPFAPYVNGATAQRADLDEGGRQVSLKPISKAGMGGDGGNEWLLAGVLAGIGLLGLGGVVTGKLIK